MDVPQKKITPTEIVTKMFSADSFSQWLGIEFRHIKRGDVSLQMAVSDTMLNGFKMAHGGIAYSLADSTLAFSANSLGNQAVSIETSISHLKPVQADDVLTSFTKPLSISKRLARYEISIENQRHELVAILHGTMYRKEEQWQPTT